MVQESVVRPKACKKKHLVYLDNLRESGVTNMFGAQPYLTDEFPELGQLEVGEILTYWMKTFSSRQS